MGLESVFVAVDLVEVESRRDFCILVHIEPKTPRFIARCALCVSEAGLFEFLNVLRLDVDRDENRVHVVPLAVLSGFVGSRLGPLVTQGSPLTVSLARI